LFALHVTGTVAFLGLDGLAISGAVDFMINTNTGSTPTDLGSGGSAVSVTPQTYSLVVRNLQLGVAGARKIGGPLVISRQPNGTLDLAMADASLLVTVSGTNIVRLAGYAAFTIDPATGFRLSGFKVNSFDLFPGAISSTPAPLAAPSTPRPVLFPTIDLASPVNRGQVLYADFVKGAGGTIRVVFND